MCDHKSWPTPQICSPPPVLVPLYEALFGVVARPLYASIELLEHDGGPFRLHASIFSLLFHSYALFFEVFFRCFSASFRSSASLFRSISCPSFFPHQQCLLPSFRFSSSAFHAIPATLACSPRNALRSLCARGKARADAVEVARRLPTAKWRTQCRWQMPTGQAVRRRWTTRQTCPARHL